MDNKESLLSISPKNMSEDEQVIAKGYRNKTYFFLAILPLAIALFFDTKYVVATAAFLIIIIMNDVEARLYDLCIRIKRTNTIISQTEKIKSPTNEFN